MASAAVSITGFAPTTPIARGVYGGFVEHFHRLVHGGIFDPGSPLSDSTGFRLDVAEAVRELDVPVVRWPGGCFVSAYHWLDGVGPERRSAFDLAWQVDEPNTFGTAEFVAWCDLVGTQPYLCTNAGTGTPEEMAAWLEYCNSASAGRWASLRRSHGRDEPFGVPYWSIGNENYGAWEIGAKTAQDWARFVAESAKMMRRVDPSVRLLTAARAEPGWTLPLLEAAGPYLDSVSVHGYWDGLHGIDEPSPYLTTMRRSLEPEETIGTTRAIVVAAGYGRAISIAFDEWNLRGWHHPSGGGDAVAARSRNDRHETYTMADAVFSAGFLNACLRNADAVTMANIAPLVNGRGPIYADAGGVVRRTTFHVLRMYSRLLGAEYVESTGRSSTLDCGDGVQVPVVDAVATRRGEQLALALVNRHPDLTVECRVDVDGRPVDAPVETVVLAGDSVDAFNSPDEPERVVPTTATVRVTDGRLPLPPHSVTVATLTTDVHPAASDWVRAPGRAWRTAGDGAPRRAELQVW